VSHEDQSKVPENKEVGQIQRQSEYIHVVEGH